MDKKYPHNGNEYPFSLLYICMLFPVLLVT